MAGVRLKLLVLKTRQVDQLRAFYQALGLGLSEERHGKGPLHYAGCVGETVLEVYPLSQGQADGATRLGFAVSDLDAVVAALRGIGASVVNPPEESTWGRRAVAHDPDGRAVELYQQDAVDSQD